MLFVGLFVPAALKRPHAMFSVSAWNAIEDYAASVIEVLVTERTVFLCSACFETHVLCHVTARQAKRVVPCYCHICLPRSMVGMGTRDWGFGRIRIYSRKIATEGPN